MRKRRLSLRGGTKFETTQKSGQEVVIRKHDMLDPSARKIPFSVSPEDLEYRSDPKKLHYGGFTWNSEALKALNILNRGEHLVLVGAAGTGKSTLVLDWLQQQIVEGRLPPILQKPDAFYKADGCNPDHPRLKRGSPGFLMGSLAHKVVQRLGTELPQVYSYEYNGTEFTCTVSNNVMTMHKAMEYVPVKGVTSDGDEKTQFRPLRGITNILPDIKLVIIDEGSQIRLDLFHNVISACPDAQIILLGDLAQLGAVAGMSALGLALATTNAVELTQVYRNKGEVLAFCDSIRHGEHVPLEPGKVQSWNNPEYEDKQVQFITYKTPSISQAAANEFCANILLTLITTGKFVMGVDYAAAPQKPTPKADVVEERFGTLAIWERLAEKLDKHYGRHTYYISTKSGPRILGAGDTYYISTELGQQEFMIMGLVSNPKFKGSHVKIPKLYSTRDPSVWDIWWEHEQKPHDMGDLFEGDLDGLFLSPQELAVQEKMKPDADEGMSKSQYTLILLNLGQLVSYVQGVAKSREVASKIVRCVVSELLIQALTLDYAQNMSGIPLTAGEVEDFTLATLTKFGLQDFLLYQDPVDPALWKISKASAIAGMLPSISTTHKLQGSECDTMVYMLHHKCYSATRENMYTACSRARIKPIIICDADSFGHPVCSDPSVYNRVPVIDKLEVKGSSMPQKIIAYKEQLKRMEKDSPEYPYKESLVKFFKGQHTK